MLQLFLKVNNGKFNHLCNCLSFRLYSFWFNFSQAICSNQYTKSRLKSIGATNVLRVVKEKDPALAKKLAIATIVLDFAKATIPLLVLKFLNYDLNLLWTVAVLTVFGHCFSIYLLFEGGKGVATGAGAMIVLLPLELITAFIVWFIVGKIFKFHP